MESEITNTRAITDREFSFYENGVQFGVVYEHDKIRKIIESMIRPSFIRAGSKIIRTPLNRLEKAQNSVLHEVLRKFN